MDKYLPTITISVTLVPHGYEYQIWAFGYPVLGQCRDFGGTYQMSDLIAVTVSQLEALFANLENNVKDARIPNAHEALNPVTGKFSFSRNAVGPQSREQTLLILAYELGKVIEYNHKARIYGESLYYSNANQEQEEK